MRLSIPYRLRGGNRIRYTIRMKPVRYEMTFRASEIATLKREAKAEGISVANRIRDLAGLERMGPPGVKPSNGRPKAAKRKKAA